MSEKVEMIELDRIETGEENWKLINQNLQNLFDKLNEKILDVDTLAKRQTITVSAAYEVAGSYVLLEAGKHPRCRIINAYAIAHDNVDDEIRIELPGIAAPVKFSATERKGSAKIFTLFPDAYLPFWSPLKVELSATRRVSVHVTFKSTETEDPND